jgi:mono/diheme cytochrome c family protein
MQFFRHKTRQVFEPSRMSGALICVLFTAGWIVVSLSSVQTSPKREEAEAAPPTQQGPAPAIRAALPAAREVFDKYCIACHSQTLRTAGLALDSLDVSKPGVNAEVLERVIAKLRAGSMPPPGRPRPEAATYLSVASGLEAEIDRAWAAHPNPGRINAVHRLNRTEYNNAIRDLFALDVNVRSLLPGDETADGSFDNFADVLTISTAHLERYLSVARQITRLATGLPPTSPGLETFEVPLHVVQDDRQSEDLPFGSRGGIAIRHVFPVDGEYLIKVRLRRQYQDYIMGMGWPQQLDVRLDGKLLKRFTVGGRAQGRPAAASYAGDGEPGFAGDPEWETYMQIGGDAGVEIRVPVKAGPRVVGVSFVRELWEPEGIPQPLQRGRVLTNDQIYMDYASVGSVQIGGPYDVVRAAAETPSRRAIFVCQPRLAAEEQPCASKILSRIARLAYRRPVTQADVQTLLTFFTSGRQGGGSFDAGIQFALERVLVDPDFLLRVHRDPPLLRSPGGQTSFGEARRPASAKATAVRRTISEGGSANGAEVAASKGAAYRLSDVEIASRLSFFLWSSVPDDRLLDLAERGQLSRPAILEQQVRRMLADPRAAAALVDDFAAQWLNLRRVDEVTVHPDFYPSFDESLLEAFKKETELFVASTLREDRSVLDLLRANYTFVNERLARHYRIPGIYGSRFRRVTLPNLDQRGGLLGNAALLATTSYPDRTSPVLRGKWLLDNIFGVSVPGPPPGVDTSFPEVKPGTVPPTIRERLAQHRGNPVCSTCHSVIDPPGFALENFDAIGGWRTVDEAGRPVDATGTTVSGEKIAGLSGLRRHLLAQPDQFPRTVTEKLLAYALGRRLEYYDRPTVRTIVRDAATDNYRWSSLILGIVKSPTFLMRAPQVATN